MSRGEDDYRGANASVIIGCYGRVLVIALAVLWLADLLLYFRDRQRHRDFELCRFDAQMDLWEE